jgi:hypothetical protein
LATAIRLGYAADKEDPNFRFRVPPDEEIQWVGA